MGTLTLRAAWNSWASLVTLGCIGFGVALSFFVPGAVFAVAIAVAAWVYGKFGTKMWVTSTEIGQSGWLGSGRKSTPRDEVQSMHLYSGRFTFEDEFDRQLLRFGTMGWTRNQLFDVSEALGVDIYDHRTQRGFGKDTSEGRLVQRVK